MAMSTAVKAVLLLVVALAATCWARAEPLGQQPSDKARLLNELDLVDDDGSIETALINYLFAKQVVNRLRAQMDVSDLQRKRSYWKQCAFNAVSCFGK
ncbi:prohormone-1-like [Schistocerca americana]|uniref:prohormone-1-like n=1 Tax=Schistocerca americana TaxID=7009 RepID=UPI001F4FC510|nr:prohormone-1-like [Schistocerca americana]XP_047113167.1 prohormone-1-like [Schistocerca piceifrons]XP_049780116.1 prohormone-1-like [Schistocerca cancellata]XP_049808309.1 prohormone-1-like [Schistocerca nitens]XP_049859868.1 prohormone-1-like [Schistocerca gregaria]XP_049957583.1 prohormone-1-like [Schistocerca serialis cubense]UGX04170.1 allatostatin CCC [Schistocerca gregaria]